MPVYLQGLTMGLAYVAPIGAQNLFVINTALTRSRPRALLTALIVIFFDVTLALACFFGAGAAMERFAWLRLAVLLVGGVVVVRMGWGLLRSSPGEVKADDEELPLGKTALRACVVTWCNPQAIIDGTVMLGAFRAVLPAAGAARFIGGAVSASCLWFTGVTLTISLFSARFSPRVLRGINLVCGTVMVFYGLRLLGQLPALLT